MNPSLVQAGQKYNRWTVVGKSERKHSHRYWNCVCECGAEGKVAASHLRSGKSKSCGCYHRDSLKAKALPKGESSFRKLYQQYKYHAAERGQEFDLSIEDFRELTAKPCFYCGKENGLVYKRGEKANGAFVGNGVDRVNNDEGYTHRNSVPCCSQCNYAKRDISIKEFQQWVADTYFHMFMKNG